MSKPRKTKSDYEVGYGKPPEHTRFKPGQSGNRKGRPKGTLNLKTTLHQALNERVTVTENGRKTTRSKLDAIVLVAINKAIKGDQRALNGTLAMMKNTGIAMSEPELANTTPSTAEDEAIIERALAGFMAQKKRSGESQ